MGVTVKTVENQLTRAIHALRERLGPGRERARREGL
jgi:DNA-directed RNA polymerase specialized sigma24 family protein